MPVTPTHRRRWLLGGAGAVLLAGVGLTVGRHGMPWQGEAGSSDDVGQPHPEPDQAYADLERQVRRSPRDGRAWVLKARADMAAGRHELAAQAYAQALDVAPRVARDAKVWVEYAEARAMVQGGQLAGEPLALIERALALDATLPQALDLAGSAAWEVQDFNTAIHYWQRLQQQLPGDDPRQQALKTALETAQRKARLQLPAAIIPRQP